MHLVSIVIPVYNAEAFVGEAVASALGQTYDPIEVIAVDDGSPDRSIDVLQGFDDRRLRIVRQPNGGLAAARNAGIREARGEFIALLDADDIYEPEKVARHISHFSEEPSLGVSFSHSTLIDVSGRPLNKAQTPRPGSVTPERLLLGNPLSNGSTAVIRRRVLDDVAAYHDALPKYFDESLRRARGVEDLDCWLRIALETNWLISCLPEALTRYRLNPAGLSVDGAQMMRSWERVIDRAKTYAPDVVARYEKPARARMLRYLAGRSIRAGRSSEALAMMAQALTTDPAILWQQARPTWKTLLAVSAGVAMPAGLTENLLRIAVGR